MGIELAAFVVEAMREFVADGASGIAVVRRGIGFRIKQRRLQHAGGEIDVIHLRIVVGVHGRRSHVPLTVIHGLANLRQLPVEFEHPSPQHIAHLIDTNDFELAVVAPLVGISNLIGYSVELFNCLRSGACTHPRQRADILLHRRFDFLHHFHHLLLGLGAEVFLDVGLSQGLTQIIVNILSAALPAGLNLLGSGENFSVEVEIGVHKSGRKIAGVRLHEVPAEISLPARQIFFIDFRVERFEKVRSGHIQAGERGEADLGEIRIPLERRRQRLEFLHCHLVIELLRIAPLHTRHRALSQRRFDPHDCLCFRRRTFRLVAQ